MVSAALCIAPRAVDRFGSVLRHLVVGLIDQAIAPRLLSSDPRVESLRLGPVQTLIHQPVSWPLRQRRLSQLTEVLSYQPPAIIHALSHESYEMAAGLAAELESDLVLHVSSLADCAALGEMDRTQVGAYISISQGLRQLLTDQLKVPNARVSVVCPGVSAAQHVTCYAHPGRAVTILCISAFERHSGVDFFIDALALLRRRGQSPMAFLLGRGRYEGALRKMVRERGLLSTVAFADPACDMSSIVRDSDIFVRPSPDRAFTADALQAMATGACVVAFPSEVVDFLRDGETALLAKSRTVDALADAMEVALTDPDEARRIAAGGLEYVREHHGISVMAERTAAVYRRLVLSGSTFAMNKP